MFKLENTRNILKNALGLRIIGASMLLFPFQAYHPDQANRINSDGRFNVESGCQWFSYFSDEQIPYIRINFRDSANQRRGIMLGISDGQHEVLSKFSGSDEKSPARIEVELAEGPVSDRFGNRIEIIGGRTYNVSAYAALNELPTDINLIPDLRTNLFPIKSVIVTTPEC